MTPTRPGPGSLRHEGCTPPGSSRNPPVWRLGCVSTAGRGCASQVPQRACDPAHFCTFQAHPTFLTPVCFPSAQPGSATVSWADARSTGGPARRFGHGACVLDFPSGVVFVYGGLTSDRVGGQEQMRAAGDVWMFDTRGQSWYRATVLNTAAQATPRARAFHAMAGTGTRALVCGGHEGTHPGPSSSELLADLASSSGDESIDCWWLSPAGHLSVEWKQLASQALSLKPQKRSGHSVTFDPITSAVVLFGGLGSHAPLGDCWYLSSAATSSKVVMQAGWKECGSATGQYVPSPRWGHAAIFFQSRFYIHGGFSQTVGGAVYARDDMWVLRHFNVPTHSAQWDRVQAASVPSGRALHSGWLAGLKLCIVGGQGGGGHGIGSVLEQTWCYDLVHNTWRQLSVPHTPALSQLVVVPLRSNRSAIAYGGQDANGNPSNRLFEFDDSRWRRVVVSGLAPSRRSGHVSFQSASEMVVAMGQTVDAISSELWVFHMPSRVWRLEDPDPARISSHPLPVAYAGSAVLRRLQIGLIYGGFTGTNLDPVGHGYALELAGNRLTRKYQWREMRTLNGVSPPARGLTALKELSPFLLNSEYLENPVIMFGGLERGSNWSCSSLECLFPAPLSDLWYF